jgi:hypothetical protein
VILLIDNAKRPGGGTEFGISGLENRRECPTRFALDQARKRDFEAMEEAGEVLPESTANFVGLHSGTLHHYMMRALVEQHVDPRTEEIEFELEDPADRSIKQADFRVTRLASLYVWRKLYPCLERPHPLTEVQTRIELPNGRALTGALDWVPDLSQTECDNIGLAFGKVGFLKPGLTVIDWKLLENLEGLFGHLGHVYSRQWLSYFVQAEEHFGRPLANFAFICTQRSKVQPPKEPNLASGLYPKTLPTKASALARIVDLFDDGEKVSPWNLKACVQAGKLCRHAQESGGRCTMGLELFDMDALLGR